MKALIKAALLNRKHMALVIFTMIAMLLATIGNYTEVLTLGVLSTPDEAPLQVHETVVNGSPTTENAVLDQRKAFQNALLSIKHRFNLQNNVPGLALFILAMAFFKAATMFAFRYSTELVAVRVSRDMRQRYFEHIQQLPMSFYQKYNIGSLSSRVTADATEVAQSINSLITNYLQTPFLIVSTLSICFWMSWQLSMIIFLGLPLIALPIVFLARRIKRIARQMQKNQESFASELLDFLAGIQTVKIFSIESYSLKKYQEQNDEMARLGERSARYAAISRPILHMIGTLFLAAILVVGLYSFAMSIPELLVYCFALNHFYEPIKKFTEENNRIQRGVAAAERMFEVLNIAPQITNSPGAAELKSFEDSLEFDNVSFRYGNRWVLRDVSFTIKKGETVAFVGPTGVGKSTIVQLIPRLYEPQEGTIRIDGLPLTAYTQESIRNCLAFVPQKPFLFLDSVTENIALGSAHTQEEIEQAARDAHAHEFISELPEQYETQLAEMGKNLSGGQQQRLAIARALVKQAPILIMDEATSALDTVSELKIKQAINALRGKVTQILIAHRLTTIEDADRIFYMEKGQIVGEGTKDQLLSSCAGFRQMWEAMHLQSTIESKESDRHESQATLQKSHS